MGDDAKKECAEVETVFVKESRGKADLTKYRQASAEVFQVLNCCCSHVERASVDEAFLDLTSLVEEKLAASDCSLDLTCLPNTCVVQPKSDDVTAEPQNNRDVLSDFLQTIDLNADIPSKKLALGAEIMENIRLQVFEKTQFRCSAGIAHNKILAKLACGINKPNKQTIIPQYLVKSFFSTLPVHKLRYLGGKLGDLVQEELGCVHIGDILKYSESFLTSKFGEKNGLFLYNICRGYNYEVVKPRTTVKSIGCSKNFLGKESIWTVKDTNHWVLQLCNELEERLSEDLDLNQRVFKIITVTLAVKGKGQFSKRVALSKYEANIMHGDVMKAILSLLQLKPNQERLTDPIINLGTYASKSEPVNSTSATITDFFTKGETSFISKPLDKQDVSRAKQGSKPKKTTLDIFLQGSKKPVKTELCVTQSTSKYGELYMNEKCDFLDESPKSHKGFKFLPFYEDALYHSPPNSDSESGHSSSSLTLVPESPPESMPPSKSKYGSLFCDTSGDILSDVLFKPTYRSSISGPLCLLDQNENEDIQVLNESLCTPIGPNTLERKNKRLSIFSDFCDEPKKLTPADLAEADSDSSQLSGSHEISPTIGRPSKIARGCFSEPMPPKTRTMKQSQDSTSKTTSKEKTPIKSSKAGKSSKVVVSEKKKQASSASKQTALKFDVKNNDQSIAPKPRETPTSLRNSQVNRSTRRTKSNTIEKMFQKISEDTVPEELFEKIDGELDFMKCVLCLDQISMFELLTHRDFHVAEKLQSRFLSTS